MKKYTMLFLFLFFNCLNYSNTFETNKKFKNSIINNNFSEHIEGFMREMGIIIKILILLRYMRS